MENVSTNSVKKNFLYQTIYQILVIVLPLITTPYVSRVLGAENVGIFSYTLAISSYFLIFAALGIENYGNRKIAQAKNKGQNELNKTFTEIFIVHECSAVLSTILYFIFTNIYVREYSLISNLQGLWIISSLFDVNWFFWGLEKFKTTVIRNLCIKILTVILIFSLVRSSNDLWLYTLIMSGSIVISQLVLFLLLHRYVSFVKVKAVDLLQHLKPLFILFVATIATALYRMIDKVMLGIFDDIAIVGCYEYADKIICIPVTLITALGTVMLPRMSSLFERNNQEQSIKYLDSSIEFVLISTFAMAFGLAGIAKEFIPFFLGDGYESSVTIVQVLAISIPFMGLNNVIRTQILIPQMKDNIYSKAVWAGAIIDVILNLIFINLWGGIGAAIATVIAYLVTGLFQLLPLTDVRQHLKNYFSFSFAPLVSGLIMFFCLRLIGNFLNNGLLCIFSQIVIGSLIYVVLLFFYYKKTNPSFVNKCLSILFHH